MAYTTLYMENPRTGQTRKAPLGFSWTGLFFGPFVPALRGDWTWTFIWLALLCFTATIAHWVMPFFYNKLYARKLVENGYIVPGLADSELQEYSYKVGAPVRNGRF